MFFAAIYRDFSTFTAQGRGRFRRRQGRDAVLGEQVPNCCVTRAFSLVRFSTGDLATWRPHWRPGDQLATGGRQEQRCGAGYFVCNPLATTGYHWLPGYLATWRPGDLATYWRPTGDFC